jgi:hypothetical protein
MTKQNDNYLNNFISLQNEQRTLNDYYVNNILVLLINISFINTYDWAFWCNVCTKTFDHKFINRVALNGKLWSF